VLQPVPDGRLLSWSEVESLYEWTVLLLGNGLSINVWNKFRYGSLYEEARRLGAGALSTEDRALFEGLATENFELVLGDLNTTIAVLDALGQDCTGLLERYQSIQAALGGAIRRVHVPWTQVPASTFAAVWAELHRFEWVFTTSYDLLIYWAMGHDDNYGRLVDVFWTRDCRFNPNDTDVRATSIPVYFLHGAMHLIAEGRGTTRKLRRTAALTLLDQFGEPIVDDPRARPLLVTEGSSRHKLQAIEANAYLAHAYERLQSLAFPVVVFGSSLGDQDRHLTEALSANPNRPVAVSMMPGSKQALRARQADVFGRVEAAPILFFDATTHPLGAAGLAVPAA
jgi:hypothetical protein